MGYSLIWRVWFWIYFWGFHRAKGILKDADIGPSFCSGELPNVAFFSSLNAGVQNVSKNDLLD